jgi:erythronate-4-phosphate dehydrogenase
MLIAVDETIPLWKEAFSSLGEICLFSGRDLNAGEIRHADALIVRSVTNVGASLLEGSSVKFVASTSAGTDHIDQQYLKARGIGFAYAPGCNSDSVSEYIFTALYIAASRKRWNLKSKSLAVIGVGNVGSWVVTKARALGMETLLCDPPLRDSTGDSQYLSFHEVLGADILTFHVPLVREGPYPTWHMLDRETLDRLSPTQLVMNASRGAVFDNGCLKAVLEKGGIAGAVLDVWEGEPRLDYALLELLDIGTPHIAGSALDGKIRATEMVRDALCRHMGMGDAWDSSSFYPSCRVVHPERESEGQDAVLSVLLQVFDIPKCDADLRTFGDLSEEQAVAP